VRYFESALSRLKKVPLETMLKNMDRFDDEPMACTPS
jgi:hypothetical protein